MNPLVLYLVCIGTPIVFLLAYALGVWTERDRWRRKPYVYELPSIRAARQEDAERGRLRIIRGGR